MKNIKIIVVGLLALGIGLAGGYFLFGNHNKMQDHSEYQHNNVPTTSAAPTKEEVWICSMHPQVRQNEFGICPICEMDLIPAGSNESDDPLVLQMTEAAAKLANIQTTTVGTSSSNAEGKTIQLSGKVQADERLASSQVAHVPGRIEKLYVTFTGEQVKTGQKLADIYSPDLIAAQRELLEALKLQSINPNLVEAARNKLRFWKISNNQITSIEESGRVLETFPLFAAESGIVTNRRVSTGDYLKQGEPLFDLMSLNKVWVLFDAYEGDLANVKVGGRIEFTTPTFPNKTFKSRVTFIDPIINSQTRTTAIRTEINNTSGQLKPEMFVNGTLRINASTKSKTQLTVPKSAVMWTGKRSVIYIKVPDVEIPSFKFREIEIGERQGDSYQVLSGLESGEEVVTYGSFTIDAAAQLNNQASMMNKNVKLKDSDGSIKLPDYTATTPIEFKEQLVKLSDAYILLKDALVATDDKAATLAANQVGATLAKVDMALLKNEAHIYWMEQLNALQLHSKKITELADVEEQRKQFEFISEVLINSIKVYGIADNTLYVQHCPMAFGNEGADWLSKEEAIQNPYFGDKMMKCGVVKAIIDKDFKNPKMK